MHADHDRRKALTFRYTKINLNEADEEVGRVDVEMADGDGPSAPKRRRLSPRPDGMDVDENSTVTAQPAVRLRRTIAPLSQAADEEDDDDEYDEDEDDDEDDRASVHSAVHQTPVSAPTGVMQQPSAHGAVVSADPTPEEFVGEMERNNDQSELSTALKSASDIEGPSTGPSSAAITMSQALASSEINGDGEHQDEDMDAEGEADDENGNGAMSLTGPSQPFSIFKAEEKPPDVVVPLHDDSSGQQSQSLTGVGGNNKGLKAGHEDVIVSSVAGSLLDPKLLRGPILDLGLEEFLVDLCDLFNQGLAIEDQVADPDKDDITLTSLFPELPLYDFTSPPQSEANGKRDKRIDESGMASGRLTYTTRLMDSNNVLLSTLQPGSKYRPGGGWDDPSDIPVAEEPRDYTKASVEIVPPTAREFLFVVAALLNANAFYFFQPCFPGPKSETTSTPAIHLILWTLMTPSTASYSSCGRTKRINC